MSFYDSLKNNRYLNDHSDYKDTTVPYAAWRYYGELAPLFYPEYHHIEILSPCDAVSYKNAVYNGADAVYFGYKEFNARAGANNLDNLNEIVEFCHSFRVKAYLALNIEFKTTELSSAKNIIIEAENAKIDAFIISDLALLPIIKKNSKAEVHASTQMGVHNYLGAKFISDMGFDRVVLSREATTAEIVAIHDRKIPIEIEAFCHGALCVAFSGACLMSSILTGNSGNRGRCNQLCRKIYKSCLDGKIVNEGYLLSAKDINTLQMMSKYFNLKLDSAKIEGRLRRPEYVGGVTDAYCRLKTGDPYEADDEYMIKALFNRGDYTDGYETSNKIIYSKIPGHIGVICGKIVYVDNPSIAFVRCNKRLNKGDGFKIIRDGKEVCGATATGEYRNGNYVLHTEKELRVNDEVRITTDTVLNNEILNRRKTIEIDVAISLIAGARLHIVAKNKDVVVDYFGDNLPHTSGNLVLTEDVIKKQFSKCGETDFSIKVCYAVIEDVYLSKSFLNSLRRDIISLIRQKILDSYKRKKPKKLNLPLPTEKNIYGDFAEIDSYKKITQYLKSNINNIVYSPSIFDVDDCKNFYEIVKSKHNLVYIKPPIFLPSEKVEIIANIIEIFDGVVANNLYSIEIARYKDKYVVGGYNLNITNSKNPLISLCSSYILSTELNEKEVLHMPKGLVYAYGHLPLMYLNHCPRQLAGEKCGSCGKKLVYLDEKGTYPIFTQKLNGYCQHLLKNGIITDIGAYIGEHNNYFDFTDEDRKTIDNVLYNYINKTGKSIANSNKLHLSRGVK